MINVKGLKATPVVNNNDWRAKSIGDMLDDIIDGKLRLAPAWSSNKRFVCLSDYKNDPGRYMNDLEVLLYQVHMIVCKNTDYHKSQSISYKHTEDGDIHELSLIHFTYNFIIWKSMFVMNLDVPEYDVLPLFLPKYFTNKEYDAHIDKVILYIASACTVYDASEILSYKYDDFIKIACMNDKFLGLTFSLASVTDNLWDDEEIYDLCHTTLEPDIQISEAEEILKTNVKRMYQLLTRPNFPNDLRAAIVAEEGLNQRAVREFLIHAGFKPSLDGITIPVVNNTNLVTGGFNTPSAMLVNSKGAIKAAVTGLHISTGGYFQKELTKSSAGIRLHKDPDFVCDTKHFTPIVVEGNRLEYLHGMYYMKDENTAVQIHKDDVHLIGEELLFRTPVTCASEEVCHVCYGHLYNVNYGTDIGIGHALILSHDNYQMTMGVKHILDTLSKMLKFPDAFERFFDIAYSTYIYVSEEIDSYHSMGIRIHLNDVMRTHEDMTDLNNNLFINKFQLIDHETGEIVDIFEESGLNMYLSEVTTMLFDDKIRHLSDGATYVDLMFTELEETKVRRDAISGRGSTNPLDMMTDDESTPNMVDDDDEESENILGIDSVDEDDDADTIHASIEDDNIVVFYVQTENKELTKPLTNLTAFIEKGKEINASTVGELVNTLSELFFDCNIKAYYTDVTVISRNLVRDRRNPTKRPDWSNPHLKPEDILITSVSKSILMSDSLANGISFGWIKQQFTQPQTYSKRGKSPLDSMFAP